MERRLEFDGWNDWSGVGWHEDCEQRYNTYVSSYLLESSEWVNTNLGTAAVNTFQVNFDPEGVGDGSFYDWIPDGEAWQFQGYDENGLPRSLNMEDSRMHTKCWVAMRQHLRQHQHQKLPRSRTKNDKTSVWDTVSVT